MEKQSGKLIETIIRTGTICIGLAFLWHTSNIWRFGQHTIQEPIRPVLIVEIVLVAFLVVLATMNLVKGFKENRHLLNPKEKQLH